jgi:hypothetical protein
MTKELKVLISTILTLGIAVGPFLISHFILIPNGMVGADDFVASYMAGLMLLFLGFLVIMLFLVIGNTIYKLLDDIF